MEPGKRPSASELKGVPSRTNPSFHRSLNVVEAAVPEVPEGELIDLSEDQDDESKALQQTLEEDKKYFDSLLSIKETGLPLYMMSCNGCSVNVMIDSGASGCYVAPKIVAGLPTRLVSNREVETAGGHILAINKQVNLPLDAQGYKHQISAYVLDTKFDIILGRNWLKMVQPVPDWELDTWIIRQDKQAYVLRPTQTRHLPELAYLISHHQVQRLERYKKIDDLFICYVHPNNDNDSVVFTRDGEQLMAEFPDVFQDKLPGLPPDRGIEHVIDTGDAVPISRPPYKMSPLELDELKRQLKELLDLRLIRPSSSPWGAPVLFVRKAGDPSSGTPPSLRLCIDYRAINRVTRRIDVPLPSIDECLERLHSMKYFSKLDLKSGYHQLRIQEDDIEKTSFNTRYGSFEWLVLLFGLKNSPSVFQKWMNKVLGDCLDTFAMVYLDDILIMSKTREEHERHVREVLNRFQEHQIIANKKKCEFFKTELEFVGYKVTAAGILPSKKKVQAIQNWPVCKNVQEVRQFIGLASHYRRWIRGFSSLSSVLTDLTKGTGIKKRSITWTPECQAAFEEIKARLCDAPVLIAPNPEKPYIIEVDSSDFAVGGVLLQEGDDGCLHPLAYESKKLSAAERNYPAQERELLAILHALRTWRCFIDGRRYTIFSDHHPLKYFRSQTKPTPRLTRWIAEIELYDPDIQYKPGRDNHVPDLLSRRDGPSCITDEKSLEPDFLYAVKAIQESDWPKFYAFGEEQWRSVYKDLLAKHQDKFVVRNDQVFRKVKSGNTIHEACYVLFACRADLIESFHKSIGHAGNFTVFDLMKTRWWWPNMHSDIKEWLAACPQCQLASRADRNVHHAPMKPLDVPPVFSCWHLDFIGELPTTINGNRWLLVAVDYATNWTIARAVPDATGEAIANFLYEEIVLPFSCPVEIFTDRGANFMSNVLNHYLGRLKTNHLRTSAFHVRSNSKVERTNGILKQMLHKYAHGQIHRWDRFVSPAIFACRVRKHRTTGYSPYFLVYGVEPKLPGDFLPPFIEVAEQEQDKSITIKGRVVEARKLQEARLIAEEKLKNNAAKDKAKWDAQLKPQIFSVGDHVLMRHENKFSLEYNWKGPFKVIATNLDTDIYQLEDLHGQVYRSWVHTDHLRPIHVNSIISDAPWFDPTAVRAAERAELKPTGHLALLYEDVQQSGEGVLS
ncbi:hypothetical protein INT45_010121 [Circinella minor]|uniref:Reverse transcriptase n=1 Tax=Circinella minor TaxID=1195481 RepID=A0A8H7VCD5_9FUNG|nr:hypothetical protein INT45_010121 [Circinella minor]